MKHAVRIAFLLSLGLASSAVAQVPETLLQPTPEQLAADSAESTVALYLAGSAAMSDGRSDEASQLFARASAVAQGEAREQMRENAFLAAIQAGDIAMAAAYAPQSEDSTLGMRRLGYLAQAVDALASGDPARADAVFATNNMGSDHRSLLNVLRPWIAAAQGDAARAVPDLPNARSGAVELLLATYNRAMIMEVLGRTEGLDQMYSSLVEGGNPVPDFQFSYGAYLERSGRKADAVKVYDQLLAAYPGDVRTTIRATAARDRARNRRAAAPPMTTPAQGAAQALISSSILQMQRNDFDNALYYLWMAQRLDPTRTDALYMAIQIERSSGRTQLAQTHLERIAPSAPEYLDARSDLVDLLQLNGQNDEAVAMARENLALAPRDNQTKIKLAQALNAAGQHAQAVTLLSEIIRDQGRNASADLYYARAISYNQNADWPNVERDLMKALELRPSDPNVMNFLGYSWADRGENLPQALQMLQQAAAASPNSGAVIDSLGWAYFRSGDLPNAVAQLERAVVLEAGDPVINDHLGDVYLAVGRPLEAVFQWERVLTLKPADDLRAQVQAKIAAHQPVGAPAIAQAQAQATPTP